MTPDKRALIKAFVENTSMAAAVYEGLSQHLTPDGLKANVAGLDRSDMTEFGTQVAVRIDATDLLEKGFAQLSVIANDKQAVQSDKRNSTR